VSSHSNNSNSNDRIPKKSLDQPASDKGQPRRARNKARQRASNNPQQRRDVGSSPTTSARKRGSPDGEPGTTEASNLSDTDTDQSTPAGPEPADADTHREPAAPPPRRRRKQSATKCVYFHDAEQLERLEDIAQRFSRGSVSSLVQQFTDAFLLAVENTPPGERNIPVTMTVWL